MRICLLTLLLACLLLTLALPCACLAQKNTASGFTRLQPVPASIIASAEAYPGGQYEPKNLIDDVVRTEYASNGKGTNTFVEFDFGRPIKLAAFQHIDRNDPATVGAS